jgi:hypothetical protein
MVRVMAYLGEDKTLVLGKGLLIVLYGKKLLLNIDKGGV